MEYNVLPSSERIQKTMAALQSHRINVKLLDTKEEALAYLKSAIPTGASVMTGASVTLEQIGFEAFLKSGDYSWDYLKPRVFGEPDPAKRIAIRKQAILADFYLGSVHAIAESGEIVIASATGSQLPAYAFSSDNVIWVAGTQKITPSLEIAMQRLREYVVPLEDQHMKQLHGPDSGTQIGKILIYVQDAPFIKRNVTMILVNEVLGF
jgi:L-lactate utilization protein LutC